MTSVPWHGDPLRMPSLDHRLLMLHFLLHNIPLCQAGTWHVTMCIITITSCLPVRDAGFFRTTGFLFIWTFLFCLAESAKDLSVNFICLFKEPDLNFIDLFYLLLLLLLVLTPIYVALVLPSISAHCVLVQQTALFIFAFKGVRKIHPTVPVAVPATLFRKWERTACNTFSILSGEPSTVSQSSTGAHTKKIAATWYHTLYGGHWLPPSSGTSGSPTCWVSCRLGQL